MKLLVFAHVPPPHHGQSYMVQLMLAGMGGDRRRKALRAVEPPFGIACYHVNARVSKKIEDIGDLRLGKLVLLFGFCLQAIWCRFRHDLDTLYYIPAPGKASALFRDWLVMFVCRPFFKRIILHWHAAGLAKWLETSVQLRSRSITFRALKHADLSIVLSNHNRSDAEKLFPKRIEVVGNGIPDPCPDFESNVLPTRLARVAARKKLLSGMPLSSSETQQAGNNPGVYKVLFLGHCTREKGLFDAIDGVALANTHLSAQNSPIRVHLNVAGEFMSVIERNAFDKRLQDDDLRLSDSSPGSSGRNVCVSYLGFIGGDIKRKELLESDCLCFPTYHYAESFGLVALEAMAFGLDIIASRWRSIPEIFPANYNGLVDVRSPGQIAEVILRFISGNDRILLREVFTENFTMERHLAKLCRAMRTIDVSEPSVPAEKNPNSSNPP